MKTLYFECTMGAAGDMISAALLGLCPDPAAQVAQLNAIGIPGVEYALESAEKCGIQGLHLSVTVHGEHEESHDHQPAQLHDHHNHHDHHDHHDHHNHHDHDHPHGSDHVHHHHHTSLQDIATILASLQVSDAVKDHALAVYRSIAQAEAQAHGKLVEEIHFHEVGTLDAVADVVAASVLLEALAPEQILVSPIHVGSGHVHCAHGILPVPAPATAYLLQGVPIYSGEIQGELCTPTGAALLKHFATGYGPMPTMTVERIGYGMGAKDFPVANCLRAMLGTTQASPETVVELQCNLDDMTPEDVAFATEVLLEAGALDVYTTPIQMKKGRPGMLLSCLLRPQDRETIIPLLFRHTTTLGLRETEHRRYTLSRTTETRATPYGPVTVKHASGFGVSRSKPEYEDLKKIAQAQGCSLSELRRDL